MPSSPPPASGRCSSRKSDQTAALTGCANVEVALTNHPEDKKRLLAALSGFAQANQLPAVVVRAADLALEEHLTNVMNYAYDDAQPHQIRVRLAVEHGHLLIEVEDDGKPFNPLQASEVDTSVPLEQKPIGGLGIHLMRRFMDELHYHREGNRNVLGMRKRLDPPAT